MSVESLLEQNQNADLLRFTTAGSVDDGKSTLIGRLLHDSKSIYDDQLAAIHNDSKRLNREVVDFALLTDGLKAEREQGITIDVAYRYFSTPKRRFIIADTPGHVQYTRNMVTGASTADLAVILIDARLGVLEQSRRHGFIASLLGIPHVIVAVNKMDLVDFDQAVYDRIVSEYDDFAARLNVGDLTYIPISALDGDNVVERSERTPWYRGVSFLEQLESVHIASDRNLIDLRFPVQYVNRPNLDFRGYCGTVSSGVIRKGDEVAVLPSGKSSRVKSLVDYDGELEYAFNGQSVTVCLEDEIDISRGDMLVHPRNLPNLERQVEAMLIWMDETPFSPGRTYLIKHTTKKVRAGFSELQYKINLDGLHRETADALQLNEIGRVMVDLYQPICCDPYQNNRSTGSFIVIDEQSNSTVGAGVIIERSRHRGANRLHDAQAVPASTNIVREISLVTPEVRSDLLGQRPATLWLTGLSGSGKSTVAKAIECELVSQGRACFILDGDNVRHGLNRDLAFSADDRTENIRRVAEVAKLMNDAGLIVITAFISPYRRDRESARSIIGEDRFVEVFVDAPLEVCEDRDPKGLYRKARAGEITDFTGVSAPYEAPSSPELQVDTANSTPEQLCEEIVAYLHGL
ncbi:MAG: sulfate adenylyltransferase subunit CysN [Planctomycetota bacterium]|jgi:bifunctional enzyme CysN/CysC